MSYPPPRYLGDSGEVSATFRPGSHPPELVNASGGGAYYLATGASTSGQFGLYRWEMGPGPSGPDTHFHKTVGDALRPDATVPTGSSASGQDALQATGLGDQSTRPATSGDGGQPGDRSVAVGSTCDLGAECHEVG